jgi:alkylation response protein AidB-like acyl-CoA dehydrogenase
MDFALDDEQSLLVATMRRWTERELRGWAAEADRRGAPPDGLWSAAGELGLLLDAVPEAAGGLLDPEASFSHLARALRGVELGRGCAGLAALIESNVEPALAVGRWGSDAAREALFGALSREASPPALAVLAHDFHERIAVADGGAALRLSGRVGPLPGLARASHVLYAASGAAPLLALVPADGPGARVEPCEPAPSAWRAAIWGSLVLDGAAVPGELVLARGEGARAVVAEVLAWYRLGLAARAVGVASMALEHAAAYGRDRVQFGQPIGKFESLAHMLDENQTMVSAARLLVLHAAWDVDRGGAAAADGASRSRDLAARAAARATIDAVQIFGGYGFVNDFPVEKLMRDARPFEALGGNEALARVLAAVEG